MFLTTKCIDCRLNKYKMRNIFNLILQTQGSTKKHWMNGIFFSSCLCLPHTVTPTVFSLQCVRPAGCAYACMCVWLCVWCHAESSCAMNVVSEPESKHSSSYQHGQSPRQESSSIFTGEHVSSDWWQRKKLSRQSVTNAYVSVWITVKNKQLSELICRNEKETELSYYKSCDLDYFFLLKGTCLVWGVFLKLLWLKACLFSSKSLTKTPKLLWCAQLKCLWWMMGDDSEKTKTMSHENTSAHWQSFWSFW